VVLAVLCRWSLRLVTCGGVLLLVLLLAAPRRRVAVLISRKILQPT